MLDGVAVRFEEILKGCAAIDTYDDMTEYFNGLHSEGFDLASKADNFDFLGFVVSAARDFNTTDAKMLAIVESYLEVCKKRKVALVYEDIIRHPIMLAKGCENRAIKRAIYIGIGGADTADKTEEDIEIEALSNMFRASDITRQDIMTEWLSLCKGEKHIKIKKKQELQLFKLIKGGNLRNEEIAGIIDCCLNIRLEALNYLSTKFKSLNIKEEAERAELFSLWRLDVWVRITSEQELQLLQLIKEGVVKEADIKLIIRHCARIRDEILEVVIDNDLVGVIDNGVVKCYEYNAMKWHLEKYTQKEGNKSIEAINAFLDDTYEYNFTTSVSVSDDKVKLNAVFERYEKSGVNLYGLLPRAARSGEELWRLNGLVDYMLERDKGAFQGIDGILIKWVRHKENARFLNELLKNKVINPYLNDKVMVEFFENKKLLYSHYYRRSSIFHISANVQKAYMIGEFIRFAYISIAPHVYNNLTLVHLRNALMLYGAVSVVSNYRAGFYTEDKNEDDLILSLFCGFLSMVPFYVMAGALVKCDNVSKLVLVLLSDVLANLFISYRMADRKFKLEYILFPILAAMAFRAPFFLLSAAFTYFDMLKPSTSFVVPVIENAISTGLATLYPLISTFIFSSMVKSGISTIGPAAIVFLGKAKYYNNVADLGLVLVGNRFYNAWYLMPLALSATICYDILESQEEFWPACFKIVITAGLCLHTWCDNLDLERKYQKEYVFERA